MFAAVTVSFRFDETDSNVSRAGYNRASEAVPPRLSIYRLSVRISVGFLILCIRIESSPFHWFII